MRLAVIGAGLAGLTAARDLDAEGHSVVVWEKSRGVGGRTATRRASGELRFDHGAPRLDDGEHALGLIPGAVTHRFALPGGGAQSDVIGAPSGNAPAKALAHGLDVRAGHRVASLIAVPDGYALGDVDGAALGVFDGVVVAVPAPQAAELMLGVAPDLAALAAGISFAPCWVVMAAWSEPLDLAFTAAFDVDGLRHAVAEGTKPGRAPGEYWVLAVDETLSREYLEAEPDDVVELALDRWQGRIGPRPAPAFVTAHRWRYAQPVAPLVQTHLRHDRLVVAGDWCGGRTAGSALRSGHDAALSLSAALDCVA